MQWHKGAHGYFCGERFANAANPQDITDEIALNPLHFTTRKPQEVFSTLAHEMTHLWQRHFGEPPRKGYHDRQWAAKMRGIGLIPTATGKPGGKETGQSVSHLIEENGRYARTAAKFLGEHPSILYQDRSGDDAIRKKKAASKTKYTCSVCGLNAWAKPNAHLACGNCQKIMLCGRRTL